MELLPSHSTPHRHRVAHDAGAQLIWVVLSFPTGIAMQLCVVSSADIQRSPPPLPPKRIHPHYLLGMEHDFGVFSLGCQKNRMIPRGIWISPRVGFQVGKDPPPSGKVALSYFLSPSLGIPKHHRTFGL